MRIAILTTLILVTIINCQNNKNSNNTNAYIDWGLKNNLKISSYIEITSLEGNKIKFIAKKDIPKKKELLTIPNSIMFNITKALHLIKNKKLNKQYKEFSNLNLTYKPNPYDFRKVETFLSYILYLIQHKPKKYKKTEFYNNYEYYLKSLDKYSIKSPLYYTSEQKLFLTGTILDHQIGLLNTIYQDEIDILSNDAYYKKELDFDDYVHNRFIINNKGLNISHHWTLVPFLNDFDDDYTLYNAYYKIKENGDVKIISKKKIKKGEEIILKSEKKSNVRRLLTEGKTNEELVDFFDEYKISAFSRGLYIKYGIKDKEYGIKYNYNIAELDFDTKAVKLYMDHAKILEGDGSEEWAYDVLASNLRYYKDLFDSIKLSKIYEVFDDKIDRINIERIIRGEKNIVDRALERVLSVIQFIALENRYKSKKNTDL